MALEQPEGGLLQSGGGGVESKAVGAAQGQPHGVACECAEAVDQIGVSGVLPPSCSERHSSEDANLLTASVRIYG
jgi:hypothetical protein